MDKIALVYNHSVSHFVKQCGEIGAELKKRGAEPVYFSNETLLMAKPDYEFKKCVYYDKDIILGTRLELAGVRLFNNIGAVELCGDKCRTYEMLKDYPQPDTIIYPKTFFPDEKFFGEFTDYVADRLSLPIVAKLAEGSQGREVYLLESREEITAFQRLNYARPHLYQKYILESRGRDIRVFVVGDNVVASMLRENPDDFRSNIALGGHASKYEPRNEIKDMCVSVSKLLGLDFAGVDILIGKNREPYICEVNSNALFTTLSCVSGVNLAGLIADHVINESAHFSQETGLFRSDSSF